MEQYIGIDLHKAFFQVAALRADGARLWEERFPHTREGIAACLGRCGPTSRIAVEASGPTWTFADQIVGVGRDLVIVDARKTRFKAGYAAKTDRLDARRLADALRRDSVVGVYYPPLAIRQVRELCRYRAGVVRMRTACKQRLHALLLRQGVPAPRATDLFGRAGQQWLATLTLPGYAGQSLAGHRHWLAALTHDVVAVTAEVERVATTDPIVQALDGIIGIGPVLALMIRAEIGVIERFPDAAHLASYAGLVPRVEQTGARCYYGRITRQGSPWLRWALVEAAIHRPRRRDDLGRWATRIALHKGRLKARVAVAHRLCAEIFRVWPRQA